MVAKSASTVTPEQVLYMHILILRVSSLYLAIFEENSFLGATQERANEIGLSQFGTKGGTEFVTKSKTKEDMGTIYSRLTSQTLSYPALVLDR